MLFRSFDDEYRSVLYSFVCSITLAAVYTLAAASYRSALVGRTAVYNLAVFTAAEQTLHSTVFSLFEVLNAAFEYFHIEITVKVFV